MKTIFLTGISGFLGKHIVEHLLQEGYAVKGLLRNKSSYTGAQHHNLTLIEGDLFSDLLHVMQGVDAVVHAAAETRQHLSSSKDYLRINYDATVLLFQTAIHCRVKQFIFISTANTVGYGSLKEPGEESFPIKSPFHQSHYAQSKWLAENFILNTDHPIHVSVVNPSFMIGAFGHKPSSCRIILMAWKKRIIFYPPGGKNFVHVKDVAQAVVQLLQTIKFRQQVLLAGENLTYKEFFQKFIGISKQRSLLIKLPKQLLWLLGHLGNGIRELGIATAIQPVTMEILCLDTFYSNKKSIQELGLSYRSIDTAIQDALHRLNQN
ncbi:MAG: NAD-dependent epimerase/dehydratase family protein [Cytophagaceae bacterium]|jgi:nucleoside-diphosphate-sugar epimerase|nr:NAD-dependent epimerase/dehydratase family protein [Cytophagaceae bacterium]